MNSPLGTREVPLRGLSWRGLRMQSAEADFASFQRRIHSLLGQVRPSPRLRVSRIAGNPIRESGRTKRGGAAAPPPRRERMNSPLGTREVPLRGLSWRSLRMQSAEADFASFQRRIHSLLERALSAAAQARSPRIRFEIRKNQKRGRRRGAAAARANEFAAGNTQSPPAGTVVEKPADAIRGGGLRVVPAANSFAPGAGPLRGCASPITENPVRNPEEPKEGAPPRRRRAASE